MSFKSNLKLDSGIFNETERRRVFGSVVSVSAKEFRNDLKQKMIQGPHTGKTYRRGKASGNGFTRSHRASKRGERPAPDTNSLVNSIEDTKTGDLSAVVEVTKPYTDKSGDEVLQAKLGRKIMTESDVKEMEIIFFNRCQQKLLDLL